MNMESTERTELITQIALLKAIKEEFGSSEKIVQSFIEDIAYRARLEHLLQMISIYLGRYKKECFEIDVSLQRNSQQALEEFVNWRQKTQDALNKDIDLYARIFTIAANLICKQKVLTPDIIKPIVEKIIKEINDIEES